MARGLKRICPQCSTRFYDLGKNPASCPKCGFLHDINAPVKPRRGKAKATIQVDEDDPLVKKAAQKEIKKPKKPVKEIEDIDLEEFEDIETLDADEDIAEIEEIEDIDDLEELEEIEDSEEGNLDDEELSMEEDVGDEALIDDIEEEEVEEEEEEEEESPRGKAKSSAKKPAPKGKKGKK